jgi:hypothetical protein
MQIWICKVNPEGKIARFADLSHRRSSVGAAPRIHNGRCRVQRVVLVKHGSQRSANIESSPFHWTKVVAGVRAVIGINKRLKMTTRSKLSQNALL